MNAVLEQVSEFQVYRAERGSLPARVVRYLMQYPQCLVTRRDISSMFGVEHRAGIDGSLQQAVAKQVLLKEHNDDLVVAWRLGPNRNVFFREPAWEPLVVPAHSPFGVPEFIRYMHIPILKATPIDPAKRQMDEADRWLNQFKVGDSAEFSGHMLEQLKPSLESFQARTSRRFNVMKTTGDRAGIERVK